MGKIIGALRMLIPNLLLALLVLVIAQAAARNVHDEITAIGTRIVASEPSGALTLSLPDRASLGAIHRAFVGDHTYRFLFGLALAAGTWVTAGLAHLPFRRRWLSWFVLLVGSHLVLHAVWIAGDAVGGRPVIARDVDRLLVTSIFMLVFALVSLAGIVPGEAFNAVARSARAKTRMRRIARLRRRLRAA